ncbi:MAG: hypothetical protein AAF288_06495 [Planctomycetota bacterium]
MSKRSTLYDVFLSRRAVLALVCAWVVSLGSGALFADVVRFQGDPAPREGVRVGGIENGQLLYRDARGRPVTRAAAELVQLGLDEHPGYAESLRLVQSGDAAAAEARLRAELGRAVRPWAEGLLRRRLVRVRESAGKHPEALETYLALAQTTGDAYLLGAPPLKAARALDEASRARYGATAERLAQDKQGDAAAALRALARTLLAPDAAESVDSPGALAPEASPDARERAASASASPASSEPARATPRTRPGPPALLGLPASITRDDPIVQLLTAGRFDPALAAAEQRVAQADRLPASLYLLGAARLARAEQSAAVDDYLDAAVAFMRLAIHYGPSGEPLVGPALVEAGYVHDRIGRLDLAAALYQEASQRIDAQRDPAYAQRLAVLRASLAARREADE